MSATRYRDPSRCYASEARDDYTEPMPVPELKCKGWLCFMLATDLENAGWQNGLCPECQDELECERIREEQNARRYEP